MQHGCSHRKHKVPSAEFIKCIYKVTLWSTINKICPLVLELSHLLLIYFLLHRPFQSPRHHICRHSSSQPVTGCCVLWISPVYYLPTCCCATHLLLHDGWRDLSGGFHQPSHWLCSTTTSLQALADLYRLPRNLGLRLMRMPHIDGV